MYLKGFFLYPTLPKYALCGIWNILRDCSITFFIIPPSKRDNWEKPRDPGKVWNLHLHKRNLLDIQSGADSPLSTVLMKNILALFPVSYDTLKFSMISLVIALAKGLKAPEICAQPGSRQNQNVLPRARAHQWMMKKFMDLAQRISLLKLDFQKNRRDVYMLHFWKVTKTKIRQLSSSLGWITFLDSDFKKKKEVL